MNDVQFESLYREAVKAAEYQRKTFNWIRFMGWVILLPILGSVTVGLMAFLGIIYF